MSAVGKGPRTGGGGPQGEDPLSEDGLLCLANGAFLTLVLEVPREEGKGASALESLRARRLTPEFSWFRTPGRLPVN